MLSRVPCRCPRWGLGNRGPARLRRLCRLNRRNNPWHKSLYLDWIASSCRTLPRRVRSLALALAPAHILFLRIHSTTCTGGQRAWCSHWGQCNYKSSARCAHSPLQDWSRYQSCILSSEGAATGLKQEGKVWLRADERSCFMLSFLCGENVDRACLDDPPVDAPSARERRGVPVAQPSDSGRWTYGPMNRSIRPD